MQSEGRRTNSGGPQRAAMLVAVRIDRWLLAARVFKTRRAAADACSAGKVKVDGTRVRAHRLVRPGDTVRVDSPRGRMVLIINALAEKRLPAALAKDLYTDMSPPPPPVATPRSTPGYRDPGSGRPSKRERRAIDRWRLR